MGKKLNKLQSTKIITKTQTNKDENQNSFWLSFQLLACSKLIILNKATDVFFNRLKFIKNPSFVGKVSACNF